jgi:hypothetical protein
MMSPTALHHMVVSLRRRHANFYFPYEAEQGLGILNEIAHVSDPDT